jgi:hypothetical protein
MTLRLEDGAWSFEPTSFVDPAGRVLHYHDRILRAVPADGVDRSLEVLRAAEHDGWFDYGLVRTWVSDFDLDGHPLVLEHARVPVVTMRGEWPSEALRQAALTYLDLSAVMARSGFALKDAHSANVLIDRTRPVIIDFGSIVPLADLNWAHWLREFRDYFLAPLGLFAGGRAELAREMTREHGRGAGLALLAHDDICVMDALIPTPEPPHGPATFDELRRRVEALGFTLPVGEWTTYGQPSFEPAMTTVRPKEASVLHALDRLGASSLIDLGANRGLHAFLAAERGAAVIACDFDEACVNDLYEQSRSRRADVLPLYMDIVWPLGSQGACGMIPAAQDRLRSELVLALGLVHHLALRQWFHLDVLAAHFAAFSSRYAVVEFVPREDWHVAQWSSVAPHEYTREAFLTAMLRHFERFTVLPSDPAPRELFVFEGRREPA